MGLLQSLRTNVRANQSSVLFRYFIEKLPEANSVAITVERLLAPPSVRLGIQDGGACLCLLEID